MTPKKIHSVNHPIVKHFCRLRTSKKYRYQERTVLVTGKKLVEELAKELPIKRLVIEENTSQPFSAEEVIQAPTSLFKKITGLEEPECIAAEIALPQEADLSDKQRLLALDAVTDPGNLGALFRSALALGWDGLYLIGGCTDPFNDKAIRAAKGATFKLPYQAGSLEDFSLFAKKKPWNISVADASGKPLSNVKTTVPIILILGNEAHGPDPKIKALGNPIAIPINPKIESLNVASAGAILMYTLKNS